MRLASTHFCTCMVVMFGCMSTQLPVVEESELPYAEPFQDADVVYITTDESEDPARETLSRYLLTQGWQLSQGDSYWISTEPRGFGGGAVRLYSDYLDSDSTRVKLFARWIESSASDRHQFQQFQCYPVAARGDRLSTTWLGWQSLSDLAELYPSERTFYSIE